jgi:sugar phosphate isomerase/epimerase
MDTVLALNNSPYYYFRLSNQRSIGYALPLTDRIVSKLADIMLLLSEDIDVDFVPGIQLGSESDGAVRSPGKQKALRKISDEKGIEYIVHIPDQLVPGIYIRKGFQQRLLGIVQGNHGKRKLDFEQEVKKRIYGANELECRYMVMHLPNGPLEDRQKIEDYLNGDISDTLSETGIEMCIENCNNENNPYYGSLSNLHALVEGLGDDHYKMCFDYGHYLVDRERIDKDELLEKGLGARVFHVHINDRVSDKHLLLGERPQDADKMALDEVERIYIYDFLGNVDPRGKAFVLERNRPFEYDQIRSSVEMLFGAIFS